MHNHPKNGLFSEVDLRTFITSSSLYGMTAVCNDGTIYMMYKTENFNKEKVQDMYNRNVNLGQYSGIKAVAKNARKLGLVYRCSIKRR